MSKYILNRILQMFPVLFGVIFTVFFLTHVLPGDPVAIMLDDGYTQEEYEAMEAYLGLDKPLPVQFGHYLAGLLRGDLGNSIHFNEPVLKMVLDRFPATFILAVSSVIIGAVVAIPLGVVSAIRRNTVVDYACMAGAQLGISMPIFWLGLMLILFLSLDLNLLPAGGRGEPPDLAHLILPACCLSVPFMATIARLTRSCMLEVLREPYITAARSRGFSEFRVIVKHALRNAMIPVVTAMGLQLSRMLGGALVIEVVFRWPGIGGLAFDAIADRDYPVMMGVVMLTAIIFIVINLVVDLSYRFFDPRIQYGTSE
jgi:peptide/nickel transport system permease protein